MSVADVNPALRVAGVAVDAVRPTFARVSLGALRRNLRRLRARLPDATQVIGVVKAEAYGHGAVPVARTLLEEGVTFLAVALVEEARVLRTAGVTAPILLLTPGYQVDAVEVVALDLTPTVSDLGELAALASAASERQLGVHLKVDTGMGRIGFDRTGLARALDLLSVSPHLRLAGCMSHLACADEDAAAITLEQIERFRAFRDTVITAGFTDAAFHLANTAGLVRFPEAWFDAVRPGIGLYGYGATEGVELEGVLSLQSRVVRLRDLPAGTTVGYGCTFRCRRATRMAILPIGYADGVSRALSNRGEVLIEGRRCPIIGRVNMDLTCVDVTDVPQAREGSPAVLIGGQGRETISAQDIADLLGTIPYEVLCNISARVPRVYAE
ncbi:MAG: alanine racemase [Nitrospirota bacterium]|jgi:alanine racemase